MPPSWLSWRPASRLLMTSRQVNNFSTFHGFKKIVPHFPRIRIWIEYKQTWYKECLDKNWSHMKKKWLASHWRLWQVFGQEAVPGRPVQVCRRDLWSRRRSSGYDSVETNLIVTVIVIMVIKEKKYIIKPLYLLCHITMITKYSKCNILKKSNISWFRNATRSLTTTWLLIWRKLANRRSASASKLRFEVLVFKSCFVFVVCVVFVFWSSLLFCFCCCCCCKQAVGTCKQAEV